MKIVYAEDFESIPRESEKYFKDLDLAIIDCAINNLKREGKGIKVTKEFLHGHQNVSMAVETIKKFRPKRVILTQIGKGFPDYKETVKLIKDYWEEVKGDCRTRVDLGYDGMKIALSSKGIELVENVRDYDPSRLNNDVLRDDMRIVMAWYSSKKQGKKVSYSYEEILNLARLIYNEIEKRKKEDRMKHEWHPEGMKKYSKELFNKISSGNLSDYELMKQAFGSPGGKYRLADKIIKLIPPHKVYTEVYAGGLAVFFKKNPTEVEVINDLDSEIAFAYKFIQNITEDQIKELQAKDWRPSEDRWNQLKELTPKNNLERFYRFYYTKRWSFNDQGRHYSGKNAGSWINKESPYTIKNLSKLKERLKGVKIYNQDGAKIIKKFDSKDTFHYIDVPYPEEWDSFMGLRFTWEQFDEIVNTLKTIKGKFIFSINISEKVKEKLKGNRWKFYRVKRETTAPREVANRKPEYEYLVMNFTPGETYTLSEKTKLTKEEFDQFPEEITLIERFVSAVGSKVDNQDKEPDDLDLVIRLGKNGDELLDFLKRNTRTQLEKYHEKAHPFAEVYGPAGHRVPIYDLKMVKRSWNNIVELSEMSELSCQPFKVIKPMKPKERFYRVDKLIDYMFKGPEDNYILEEKLNGFRINIHKKDNEVKIYSDQEKDITLPFPTIVRQAREFSSKDYIVDGEFVPYENGKPVGRNKAAKYIGAVKSKKDIDDSNVKFTIFDCLYYDKNCIMNLSEYERKKILRENFNDTKNIKKIKSYTVRTPEETKPLVKELESLPSSEGCIVKRPDWSYEPGKESDAWIKFRIETELHLLSLGTLPVKGTKAVRHRLGIYVTEQEVKSIDSKYLTDFKGRKVLTLGNSFSTLLRGDRLIVNVEECWRHYKNGKYHYSLHKPNVRGILKAGKLSTIDDLEDAVMARGVEVVYTDKEGDEVIDFPERMQRQFREIKDKNAWMPFSANMHWRGHRIKEGERDYNGNLIPEKYKYRLNSLHHDVSLLVPDKVKLEENEKFSWNDKRFKEGYSEGLIVLSPTTTDPEDPDDFVKGEKAKKGGVRFLVKYPERAERLLTQCISPIGHRGATPNAPGVLVIVARGYYRVLLVEDHRIRLEFKCEKGNTYMDLIKEADRKGILIEKLPPEKLKDLNGIWQLQIAHIGDRHIMLLRYMGQDSLKVLVDDIWNRKTTKGKVTEHSPGKEDIMKIGKLTLKGKFRPTIAKEVHLSENTIYKYQKELGFY